MGGITKELLQECGLPWIASQSLEESIRRGIEQIREEERKLCARRFADRTGIPLKECQSYLEEDVNPSKGKLVKELNLLSTSRGDSESVRGITGPNSMLNVANRLKYLRTRGRLEVADVAGVLQVDSTIYEMVEEGKLPYAPEWIPILAAYYGVNASYITC